MKPLRLFALTALVLAAPLASASSFIMTTDTIVNALGHSLQASTDASSSLRDDKVVRAARDDAASFVATDGAIRGARLEAAFVRIRDALPNLQANDQQLAEAILAI